MKKLFAVGFILFASILEGADLISNPTFKDADSDGKPDGWELKTFFLEKNRNGTNNLSLKVPREKDYPVEGTASTIFNGDNGYYRVKVRYLDEPDGVSKAKLVINGEVLHIWDFDSMFGTYARDEIIDNVSLKKGDILTIWGKDNWTEYCRIIGIWVEPSPNPPTEADLKPMTVTDFKDPGVSSLVPLCETADLSGVKNRPIFTPSLKSAQLLFWGKKDETLLMEFTSENEKSDPNAKYTLAFIGDDSTYKGNRIVCEKTPIRWVDGGAFGSKKLPASGTYKLTVEKTVVDLGDRPWVISAPFVGEGKFYFFVPEGTKAFSIISSAAGGRLSEITLLAPDNKLVKKMDVQPRKELVISVQNGQDNGAWILQVKGLNPEISLRGVPPYLAVHPDKLLVPNRKDVGK